MDKSLKHFGILGMRWGHRRARNLTPSTQHLSKKGGVTTIVTRRFGDRKIIRRTPASPERVKAFLEKQRNQKAVELHQRTQKAERIQKAASLLVAAYSAYSIAKMIMPTTARPNEIPRWMGNLAWTFGTVVSNSPIR